MPNHQPPTTNHPPPEYESTRALDDLRSREYPLLDSLGHVYLDYTAGNLVPLSLVDAHTALLRDHLLGNPHSTNPTSALTTSYVEETRAAVLNFFNADPEEYLVIFTANATQALKLVGEAYPFGADGEFLLTFDNHNSVNGIREFARAKHCPTTYVPIVLPEMRVDEAELRAHLTRGSRGGHRLFAYPAQSNFSGVQHPLDWISLAQ
ncbi:MAG TPA: aminotransferase class V-fold PLP-dependent enzyme, partial [Vicinamibacterales bacterium]|nr:aminotransferase class V-fold PLP-dependent enzyme [Vicinamibacterales bacterium]